MQTKSLCDALTLAFPATLASLDTPCVTNCCTDGGSWLVAVLRVGFIRRAICCPFYVVPMEASIVQTKTHCDALITISAMPLVPLGAPEVARRKKRGSLLVAVTTIGFV